VGWIKMEGTQMDYPVMQTPDEPNYYLYRSFDKKDSARGSIYAREVCDLSEPSDNITIFGHNMADGSMFACLNNYVHKYNWDKNSLIFFDTLYEYHTYKIFAVFKTSANIGQGFSYHQFVDAENAAEFDEFVSTCKKLSFYDTGITPVYGDKLICLSTCEYTLDNGRLVVAAVRIT
jgi:sortase B